MLSRNCNSRQDVAGRSSFVIGGRVAACAAACRIATAVEKTTATVSPSKCLRTTGPSFIPGIFITDFRGFFFLSNLSTTDFEMEFVLNVEIFPVAGNAVSKYDVAAALTRLHFVSFRSNLSPIYLYNE